jgi:undecaprenyl diphosphate synthase
MRLPATHMAGRAQPRSTPVVRASLHLPSQHPQPPAAKQHTFSPAPLSLPDSSLPQHIAVIMDGNARWARQQGLPRAFGHQRGVDALRRLVQCCRHWHIPCVTVYALSSENFHRPPTEVGYLLKLFEEVLEQEVGELQDAGVKLQFIGDIDRLPPALQQAIAE